MNEWWFKLRRLVNQSRVISAVILVMVMLTCLLLLIKIPVVFGKLEVTEGLPLTENIYSNIEFRCEDHERSAQEAAAAAAAVPRYYRLDETARDEMLARFDQLNELLKKRIDVIEGKTAAMIEESLDPGTLPAMIQQLSGGAMEIFRDAVKSGRFAACLAVWQDMIRKGIRESDAGLRSNDKILTYGGSWARTAPMAYTDFYPVTGAVDKMTADVCQNLAFEQDPDGSVRNEIHALFQKIVKADLKYDDKMTEAVRQTAREDARVFRKIAAGQILLPKKAKLTADDVILYEAYRSEVERQLGENTSLTVILRMVALTFALTLFICIYTVHVHPEIVSSNRAIWVLGGISILSLIIFRIMAGIFLDISMSLNIPQLFVFLVIPLAFPTILISVIFGFRSAIFVGLFTSGIAAFALSNSFPVLVTGLLVCCAAGFSVRYTTDYKHFFLRAFVACFLTTSFAAAVFMGNYLFHSQPESLQNQVQAEQTVSVPAADSVSAASTDTGEFLGIRIFTPGTKQLAPEFDYRLRTVGVGLLLIPLISGLLTALLALLALFMLESFFGIVSNMSYTSYADRNHPLLKRLQQDAPGTYLHSERVSQLAEEAAKKLDDISPVQVQACALFHDVGKLKYPGMFTENNAPGENMHGGFLPRESADFIRQHVIYGQELAKKYKLPPLLQKAIRSHHGTDFISFFYEQAKNDETGKPKEEDFRYPGPLVNDREITLLTLADSCEAAVHSLDERTEEKIRMMVEKVFGKKLQAGQLDASDLTLHEIDMIKESFIRTLTSMHKNQKRIAYPQREGEK